LTMQLINGAGSWKPLDVRADTTFEVKVSVGTTGVSVTRFHHDPSAGVGAQSTLLGQYDDNTIRATGREISRGGARECALSLARHRSN
jgi:hypothetical protein